MVHVYMTEFSCTKGKAKEQSKWAYGLLNLALERDYPKVHGQPSVDRDEGGKPYFPDYPEIHFNLSHSGCYAACAIGEKPVGIDVECWKARKGGERVVRKFHPLEQEMFQASDETERVRLFHELWVLKESFMKAEGRGLRIPLDSFYMEGICKETGRVEQRQNHKTYYYKLYRTQGQVFSLAVCSEDENFEEAPIWLYPQNPSN